MRVWEFAVERWRFTLVMFSMLVGLGAFALRSIPYQEDPSVQAPQTLVVLEYPGADAFEVEERAVKPVEDALAQIDDLKKMRSSSQDSLGTINVEFDWGSDPDRKYDEVVREVNALRGDLPAQVQDIRFRRFNPNLVNIVELALVAPDESSVDPLTLRNLTKDLKDAVESVPGIRRAEMWGYPEPEMRVALDLGRLGELGLGLPAVMAAVQGTGADIPGGAVDSGARRLNLRSTGNYESVQAVGDTVIAARNGSVTRLSDVASVGWSTQDWRYLSRYNGQRAALVTATMKDGYNIFAVQSALDRRMSAFAARLPQGVRLETGFRQADNVASRLRGLGRDFLLAVALVALTLLPLGLRAAAVVMVAIPLSLAIGLIGLWTLGYSLNQISIAGFVVALGLVVDDAIVVVENIARHLRGGAGRVAAATRGTAQIAVAVAGCTAALIFAFLPLLNLPEGAGKFTRGLPMAVALSIVSSLAVAMTIVPFLASRVLSADEPEEGNLLLRLMQRGISRFYAPLVRRALGRPRAALALALGLFVASLGLLPVLGFEIFPAADKPQFIVNVRAAEGSSLDATDRALRRVEAALAREPAVRAVMSNLGQDNPQIYYNQVPRETRSNVAQAFVSLDHWDPRQSLEVLERVRQRVKDYAGAQISVKRFEQGASVEAPIAMRVIGPNLEVLRDLAGRVETAMKSVPGTRDVENPLRRPRIDLDLGIDLDKAGMLGLQTLDVDRGVRLAVAGYAAATFRDSRGEAYPVMLRLPRAGGSSQLAALDDIFLTSGGGAMIPLAQVSLPRLRENPVSIERFNRQRSVTILSDVQDGYVNGKVSAAVMAAVSRIHLPPGYWVEAGGEAEQTAQNLGGLGSAAVVAVFGILAVLVLEFGSFRSCAIVAGVVPFGILGALVALWFAGYPLSYMTVIGFMALIGVEIKNSILLVDFTNQLRREGMPLDLAIGRAGELRFLPVLLTSVTAIGGLLPLALARSALYSPIAVVLIGGLISSTLLARIVTPVMYKVLPPDISRPGPR